MCGIVGVYSKKGELSSGTANDFISDSLKGMIFRGPDGQRGALLNNYLAVGFARLSIRDLSENGMQPMQSDCGQFIICFNGEIYNTDELLQNLKIYNIDYKSTSDTEIILYHFKYFGFDNTIKLLDGIFAIAFYDKIRNELFLARDRAGVKPLYVYNDENYLIFSSHYNQVINNSYVKTKEISLKGFSSFLKLGYVPPSFGFFKKTSLIPQGSFLSLSKSTYKSPTLFYEYGKDLDCNRLDLKELIKESVDSQLISDVPVGTFLSGGIDSTIISMVANDFQKVKAFNIGFSNGKFDESETAKKFSQQKGIDFNARFFDHVNYVDLLEDNIKAFSEPFSDYSSLPTLLLSKFTKEHVTVALSGDGADELFYGYQRNLKYGLQANLLTSSYFNKVFKIAISKVFNRPLKLPVYEILSNPNKALIESNYITGVKLYGKYLTNRFFDDVFMNFLNNKNNKIVDEKHFLSMLRKYEYYYHLQRILIKVDRASMYHSLETRVPFLSNKVIDGSLKFDFNDCTNSIYGKLPLRNIIEKEVKGNLFSLPKKGFTFSIQDLINNDESGIFPDYILQDIPELNDFLNKDSVEKMYYNHVNKIKGYENTSWLLWSVFSLKSWYYNHI